MSLDSRGPGEANRLAGGDGDNLLLRVTHRESRTLLDAPVEPNVTQVSQWMGAMEPAPAGSPALGVSVPATASANVTPTVLASAAPTAVTRRRTGGTAAAAASVPPVLAATPRTDAGRAPDADGYGSDDSVESDYYYDDTGATVTYYRPRKFPSTTGRSQGARSAEGDSAVGSLFRGLGIGRAVPPTPADSVHAAHHHDAIQRKAEYPVDNGSIYLAPPSTRSYNRQTTAGSRVEMQPVASVFQDQGDDVPVVKNTSLVRSIASNKSNKSDNHAPFPNANGSLGGLPEGLHHLGHEIHKLTNEELLHISAMVSRKANREVYSVLQYTGEAWYLPEIRRTRPGEKEWEFGYKWGVGLIITLGGRRLRLRMLSYVIRISIMALIWFIVWASTIPKSWSYRAGYFLDPYVTVLLSAIVGGLLCRLLQIPPLVGVLWIGIVWNNIPEVGYFTSGILPQVRTIASRSGLAVIVMRCGFAVNAKAVKPLIQNCIFAASGLLFETIIHALVAQYYLGYNDWKWSLCQGVTGAVPSAAIVVPGILLLQAEGYSRSSGPLPLLLATLGLEAAIGIWAANFLNGLITSDKSVGYLAGMGPVQIFGGLVVGLITGALVHLFVWILRNEADRLSTGKYSEKHLAAVAKMSVFVLILCCNGLMYLAYEIDMAGGGVVATMTCGFIVSHIWSNLDAEWADLKKDIGAGLASVWDLFAMPCLFSLMGSRIVLSKVFDGEMFPKALLLFVVSVAARMLVTMFSSIGLGFTWKERVYHTLASNTKATVQIAMAAGPLEYFAKKLAATPAGDPAMADLEHKMDMANMFQTTNIVFVLISAPLSAILITRMGARILNKD